MITYDVKRGVSKSCGCLAREITSAVSKRVNTKHGMDGTVIYRIWIDMRRRCHSPQRPDYHRYGGRGITVCDEWRYPSGGFERFYADMGDRPSDKHSLERSENDGPYCKDNCYWATKIEQGANTRTNRKIEVRGEIITVTAAARKYGMKKETVFSRLNYGWTPEAAIFTPPRQFKSPST